MIAAAAAAATSSSSRKVDFYWDVRRDVPAPGELVIATDFASFAAGN